MTSKKITRTRHYCDFCKKGMWTLPRMVKHERGCTANPNRVCGLCRSAMPPLEQKPIELLLLCLNTGHEDFGLKKLRELTENCPACILAAIRQSGIQGHDEDGIVSVPFNFKEEYQTFWAEVNGAKEQHSYY